MEVQWGHVRQIILDDRVNGYKPDKQLLRKLRVVFPDCKVIGFGKYYLSHWYVLIESMKFPYTDEDFPIRPAIPLSSIRNIRPVFSGS